MSFGKCKRRLKALINRKDLTDELAGDFITDAIADMERVLRIGPMEALVTQNAWDGVKNAIVIPPGFLEGINLFTNDGELTQVDMASWITMPDCVGKPPEVYVKVADRWLLKPTPAPDTNVYLHYYAQSLPLASDDDANVWTQTALNAVVYTAGVLAADFFQMENEYVQRFGGRATEYVNNIAAQDLGEKWSGRLAIPRTSSAGEY